MQYLFTERAHLMCPRMCFGIAVTVPRPFDADRIRAALPRLSDAHPFLNALLGYEAEGNRYYYRVTDRPRTELFLYNLRIAGADAPEVMDEYRQLTGREWDLFEEGFLKLAAWPAGDGTCFLLVFHHLLADGRGALMLARELADLYALDREPVRVGERLIASVSDLPADSRLPFMSRVLIKWANKTHKKEGRALTYPEYRLIADEFLKEDPIHYKVVRTGPDELERVLEKCRARRVTVNDWLVAKMLAEENTRKVIMACDLRDCLECFREGALGNYATAFSVEIRSNEMDPFRLAEKVRAQVARKMSRPREKYLVLQCYAALDPEVLDAAFAACRGGFPGKAGRFVGSVFFGFGAAAGRSVTNLGSIGSGSISSGLFIPPASPAVRTTWGVLTVNGVMTVCAAGRGCGSASENEQG